MRERERHHLLRGPLLVLAFLNVGPRSLRRDKEWMGILGFVEKEELQWERVRAFVVTGKEDLTN
jgi:hypothetical protein